MKKPVKRTKRIKRYDSGGAVSDSGASSSAASSGSGSGASTSGLSSYYSMMSQLRGSLGGSRDSPYATAQGGNAYFNKGGKVKKVVKRGRR